MTVGADAVLGYLDLSRKQLYGNFEDGLGGPGTFAENFKSEIDGQFLIGNDAVQGLLAIEAYSVFSDQGFKGFSVSDAAAK